MKRWLCLLLSSLPLFAARVDGKWSIAAPGVGELVMELNTAGDAERRSGNCQRRRLRGNNLVPDRRGSG